MTNKTKLYLKRIKSTYLLGAYSRSIRPANIGDGAHTEVVAVVVLSLRRRKPQAKEASRMTSNPARAFIKRHGIVLESARGPVPNRYSVKDDAFVVSGPDGERRDADELARWGTPDEEDRDANSVHQTGCADGTKVKYLD